ncbi:protein enabled homolog [Sturnira hondurensis]|uniref:protein enabled homolog n=1 Tax=Sturnira hondurensis TaxID=192404 RepID=UPI00187B01AB|nr:protein enabled homolog [Sturnira hondurensis]
MCCTERPVATSEACARVLGPSSLPPPSPHPPLHPGIAWYLVRLRVPPPVVTAEKQEERRRLETSRGKGRKRPPPCPSPRETHQTSRRRASTRTLAAFKGGNEGETPRNGPALLPHSLWPRLLAPLLLLPARSGPGLTTKMAAPPAADKEEQPPPTPPPPPPPPAPRPSPKRKANLPITESLLFPRIHYHQCTTCECVPGRGESSREGRASGRAAAPAPGSGAPSATLSTSPLLAPALPGHLPPSTPRSLSTRGEAPPTRRKRPTGGEGGNKMGPGQPGGEQLPSPPSPSPPPALLCPSRPSALLRQPPPPVPPLPLHQLHPGNSEAAAFGKPRQFPPRPSSTTLGPPPLPRATRARCLRQTSVRSSFPLPLPLRPGSTPPHPLVLSGCRRCFSSSRRPLPFQFKGTAAWGPARGWSQGPRGAPGRSRLREEDGGAPEKPSRTK